MKLERVGPKICDKSTDKSSTALMTNVLSLESSSQEQKGGGTICLFRRD
jgi:hypothetical protein